MKIFLSHSSKDKALVRDIRRNFPSFLLSWMDEFDLTAGESIGGGLQSAIQHECDFLLLLVSKDSMKSRWVGQEIDWALEKERVSGRKFILPVVIDDISKPPKWLSDRLCFRLHDQEEHSVKALGDQISNHIVKILVKSWDKASRSADWQADRVMMSGAIGCDRVNVIADRNRGPYSHPRWLGDWQEEHSQSKTEVIVIARTAKWWYQQINDGAIKPSDSLSIDVLASDPVVSRHLLADDDRSEFSKDLELVLGHFAKLSRDFRNFNYALAPNLVLDSFTFVKSTNDSEVAALVVLDLYTGTKFKGPRPQIVFQHTRKRSDKSECIVTRLENRARRMLHSGGQDVSRTDANRVAQPFKQTEEEPSRRDSAARLARFTIPVFDCYEGITASMSADDEAVPVLPNVPPPVCVQIEITDRCLVSRCLGCSRGLRKNPEDMHVDTFRKLIRDLAHMGTSNIVLSGGEPLAHPQFADLIKFAADMGMSIAVLTDGLLIADEPQLAEKIGATVSSLRISVDGFSPKAYRQIRMLSKEHGNPIERLEHGLERIAKARQNDGAKLEHVGICMTLFSSNVDEITNAREWVQNQASVDSLVFKFAHGTSETVSETKSAFTCSPDDIAKARDDISSPLFLRPKVPQANQRYVETYVDKMGAEAIAAGEPTAELYDRESLACFTPLLFSLVSPSGGVYICCHTYYDNSSEHDRRNDLMFGNILAEPFSQIWREKAFARVKAIHRWNKDAAKLECTCPMRNECTRHWKHNQLLTPSYSSYCSASLTGRKRIAEEIRKFSDARPQAFWM